MSDEIYAIVAHHHQLALLAAAAAVATTRMQQLHVLVEHVSLVIGSKNAGLLECQKLNFESGNGVAWPIWSWSGCFLLEKMR